MPYSMLDLSEGATCHSLARAATRTASHTAIATVARIALLIVVALPPGAAAIAMSNPAPLAAATALFPAITPSAAVLGAAVACLLSTAEDTSGLGGLDAAVASEGVGVGAVADQRLVHALGNFHDAKGAALLDESSVDGGVVAVATFESALGVCSTDQANLHRISGDLNCR